MSSSFVYGDDVVIGVTVRFHGSYSCLINVRIVLIFINLNPIRIINMLIFANPNLTHLLFVSINVTHLLILLFKIIRIIINHTCLRQIIY